MSRIVYNNGRLFLNLSKEEIKIAKKNNSIELSINELKTLKEEIYKADLSHWSKVEVFDAIKEHQLER
jgi:hypothetical protein